VSNLTTSFWSGFLILGSNDKCHYFFSGIKIPPTPTLKKLIYKFTGTIFTLTPTNSAKANPTGKCCPVAPKTYERIQKTCLQ
jgi:hypothetical protein